ncbi:DUF4387 family protein [Agrobacterium vitis]|uniref:DUF4387 family protein n=1 Tax=Agrobacterium vitis TaxID=373 RepID=A0A6L6VMS4_AGRVI|nr:DUF4387 domain-containing protein [Agrobacterium vitis]MUZ75629.1 DUF4387 family protein [Agrobacterium vitis]
MNVKLIDIASVIRSKNSGPFELTLDIIFKSRQDYETIKASHVFNPGLISRLYGLTNDKTVTVASFDPACAIKITFPRRIPSGSLGDTDIYGAQQHAPLLTLEFEGALQLE